VAAISYGASVSIVVRTVSVVALDRADGDTIGVPVFEALIESAATFSES